MRQTQRETLQKIYHAGVAAVAPDLLVRETLSLSGNRLSVRGGGKPLEFDLSQFDRVLVIGGGKATGRMAAATEAILGDRISAGVIAVKFPEEGKSLRRVRVTVGGHPTPDAGSVEAAEAISELARSADGRTLVLNLVSGGGSALLAGPWRDETGAETSLADKRETTRLLLGCGAAIGEINCVRKHLSGIKGGRLAGLLAPATVVSLILSDVVGDRLDVISSGPTAPDPTTFSDMAEILDRYGIRERVPVSVRTVLERGLAGEIPETPGPDDPAFQRVHNRVIGTNFWALTAAKERAEELGFPALALTSRVTGEAREAAKFLWGIAADAATQGVPLSPPCCILAGGETAVTLRGEGKGGRNQETALAFLAEMAGEPEIAERIHFLAGATDGDDGPTDAAGAFADGAALSRAREEGLSIGDFLNRNDAYPFFQKTGALFKPGPTGTNVCDLMILLIG
ncbi:MAG: glycerate kinase [Desulfococcaceae bacterium]